MSRLVSDKAAHLKRVISLRKRLDKLAQFMEKLLLEFEDVSKSNLKEASHSYVRMLNKLHHEFDIDDSLQKKMQREIYGLLLSSVNSSDHRHVVQECQAVTKKSAQALRERLKLVDLEIQSIESPEDKEND